VILLSDGKANTGVVDPNEITDVARASANHGIRITTVGVGLDYNEDLMEAIAESGRGNYYYVKDSATLESVMAGELKGIQGTVATNVELRFKPSCDGIEIEEVIGYESRQEGAVTVVAMTDLFGGDSRKILVKVRVPDRKNGKMGTISGVLAYRDAKTGKTGQAQVALGIEVTDDHMAADASVNKDVIAQVLKADAAKSMRAAAKAYEENDREGALQILRQSSASIGDKRDRYNISAGAAAPAMSGLADMAAEAQAYDPGSMGGKDLLKKNKAEARKMTKGK
jgi:Ca-activated chloride channel family protein